MCWLLGRNKREEIQELAPNPILSEGYQNESKYISLRKAHLDVLHGPNGRGFNSSSDTSRAHCEERILALIGHFIAIVNRINKKDKRGVFDTVSIARYQTTGNAIIIR